MFAKAMSNVSGDGYLQDQSLNAHKIDLGLLEEVVFLRRAKMAHQVGPNRTMTYYEGAR